MKRIILRGILYSFLLVLMLEALVRVFHLHKDYPYRYIDEYQVEKWVPNQEGYRVTGNRRQNFSKYYINNSGYNSYREFNPSVEKRELALVGDSFIEGFHQNYYNSIGKKIENKVADIEVYEYGYAGYDFADQLHLVSQYKNQFELIDHIVFGIKFENDFTRSAYKVEYGRMALESPKVRLMQRSKLIVYLKNIGVLPAIQSKFNSIKFSFKNLGKIRGKSKNILKEENTALLHKEYIENFKSLVKTYGFDKDKNTLMLDSSITPKIFIDFLNKHNYPFIDIGPALQSSKKPTTLIYDRHWNNNGRTIVAKEICDFILNR
ncbi:hypothetical protein [Spongiivirga citrea]|uniref:SGNH/GDSL hydrolase family protein n=1 Tax=Spongiivirga citrea TaxID=1481457 RepID=A0A6M0CH89_9FLAO|nr:hypothetical protein [Spongiivirga citrea]NER16872.1 hypothetical protein [Spongiivirga citrea]